MCEVRGQVPRGARRHVIVPAKSKEITSIVILKSLHTPKPDHCFLQRSTPIFSPNSLLLITAIMPPVRNRVPTYKVAKGTSPAPLVTPRATPRPLLRLRPPRRSPSTRLDTQELLGQVEELQAASRTQGASTTAALRSLQIYHLRGLRTRKTQISI